MHEKCRQMGLGLLQCLLPKTISDQMKWKVNFSFVGREGSFCCYHDVSTSIARTMKVTSKIREMSTKKPWEILWEPGTFQESSCLVWRVVIFRPDSRREKRAFLCGFIGSKNWFSHWFFHSSSIRASNRTQNCCIAVKKPKKRNLFEIFQRFSILRFRSIFSM